MDKDYHKNDVFTNILGISETFNLTDADLQNRGKSFLDRRTLELAKVRRVSDDIGHQILGIDTRKKGVEYAGVAIPYFDVLNTSKVIEYNLRRDNPDYEENGKGEIKEKGKYKKPHSTKNFLYVPPMMPRELLERADKVKVFFEGEFKALAAARVASENYTLTDWHFIPLAISGVENFRTKKPKENADGKKITVSVGLPEFDEIEWKKSKVVILFDSDLDEKQQVKSARARLKTFLQEKGAKVFFADLPKEFEGIETKGFDDFLGAVCQKRGESEAVKAGLEIITKAQTPKPPKSPIADNYKLIQQGETNARYNVAGVWYDDGETPLFICSPLEIIAETQTEHGTNYGKLMKWHDTKSRPHQWAMPDKLIHTNGNEIVQRLSDEGVNIAPNPKVYERLRYYISFSSPDKTIICTEKVGWHESAFVLPDEVFGAGDDEITFQTEHAGFHKFSTKGNLEDWREKVGKFCAGNSRLVFAVSTAFACPILPIAEITGGGFHFRGLTSFGKTTALLVAGSVCGGSNEMHGYCQTWKATANGLEILAETHNHLLLCLDEIGECEAREVGNIAYMLANGQGKNRMARNTARRKSYSWHLLFLSSGERRLSDIMHDAGQMTRGGQEVRLCDIEADTGRNGMFEVLHGFKDGSEFSDYLRESSREFYGTALREFLRRLVEFDREKIKANWRKFQPEFIGKVISGNNAAGEVLRVASRFALVAFAGEMASRFGLTGWQAGEATKAACDVFQVWLDGRQGHGGTDAETVVNNVRAFIEAHGSSRFQWLGSNSDAAETEKIHNRVGFKRKNKFSDEIEFLFLQKNFSREVCKGVDAKFAATVLAERGFLERDSAGNLTRNERCAEIGQTRVFVINSKIFADDTKI